MSEAAKAKSLKGTGKKEADLIVEKSNPLLTLWRSPLTVGELQILDTYLARINSEDPEHRRVVLEKGELERLLGVDRIRKEELEVRLKHLMGTVVKLEDGRKKKGFTLITLMEKAQANQDEKTGFWTVEMQCSASAMEYIFNIQQIGYLRYKLRSVTRLKSRYSYVLFLYLESNRFRLSWTVPLDQLKKILNCEAVETLKQYKYFNSKVLQPSKREIEEKTDCRFTFEPVKKGRTVIALTFVLSSLAAIVEQAQEEAETSGRQMNVYDFPEFLNSNESDQDQSSDRELQFYMDACEKGDGSPAFTVAEMIEILDVLRLVPIEKLPDGQSIELKRYHFLRQSYNKMMRYSQRNEVKNKVSYLIAMIKKG